jgi:hypothetical protein
MRTLLALVVAFVVSVSVYGQGTVNFSNIGIGAPVLCDGTLAAAGTALSVALYFAPYLDSIEIRPDDSIMTQVGASAHLIVPGIYNAGIRQADISPPGYFAWFQVRVWETAFGSTYEQASNYFDPVSNRSAILGKSSIIKVDTGDPTTLPPGTPASLRSISGINAYMNPEDGCVPEPSAVALGLLGVAILWLLRKGKTDAAYF